jgi:hypothetical protein
MDTQLRFGSAFRGDAHGAAFARRLKTFIAWFSGWQNIVTARPQSEPVTLITAPGTEVRFPCDGSFLRIRLLEGNKRDVSKSRAELMNASEKAVFPEFMV